MEDWYLTDTSKLTQKETNIGGNYYNKHRSLNPIVKYLMKNFYNTYIKLVLKENISNMVDIGCGESHLVNILGNEFIKRGLNIKKDAFDIDPGIVKIANVTYPNLNVRGGNILTLKGNYDLLIASEILEHLIDYKAAILNCKKIAKICIFSVPNEPWFRIANIIRLKYLKRLGNTPGHINYWSKHNFKKLLKNYFNNVEIYTTGLWTIAVCK
jgi:2-polyprenyl-3-methyl-5-hydroxy-6-metoxy-1,4-benzoquinol methylase